MSEVVKLKVKHIDAALGVIRVEQSKGKKDRHVMLSPETNDLLKEWWKVRTKMGRASQHRDSDCRPPPRCAQEPHGANARRVRMALQSSRRPRRRQDLPEPKLVYQRV